MDMVALIKYTALSIVDIARVIMAIHILALTAVIAASAKYTLLVKPASRGTPTIENAPTAKARPARGFLNPDP